MYIKKIVLKNIRCFDEFTLEFEKRLKSCLIVGDNGEGKSTLLRSIAMGLCDESSAAALFRELGGNFIRRSKKNEGGWVDIYLSDWLVGSFVIETKFESLGNIERVRQRLYKGDKKLKGNEIQQHEFPWGRIFVTGYGAGVRTLGYGSVDSYLPVDAVYFLFRYDEPLQNPEVALRRVHAEGLKRGKKDVLGAFLELLRGVLNLKERDGVYLTKKGIEVRGPWGRSQLEALADGHKSMIIWVLDLIGRRLLYGRTLDPKKMTGIVLLDEVEQHLHPCWQLKAMSLIREAFPKIQFIATTHSPLVVSGCKDCKIRKAKSPIDELGDAYGWRAEDVYREILDLGSSRYPQIQADIDRYRELELKSLSGRFRPKEVRELKMLKKRLEETLPGSDPLVLKASLESLTEYVRNRNKDGS